MRHALVSLALLFLGCAGTPPQTCTPEARDALIAVYEEASGAVIDRGACDKYDRIEDCPAYLALEAHYLAARKGICP